MRTNPITRNRLERAFTLIELLVVMTIIAVLAFAIFGGVNKAMLRARKITCMSVMKNAGNGLTNYAADNGGKNPTPPSKKDWDTIYGDPGGNYTTEWLLAVLLGTNGTFKETDGSTVDTKEANPTGTAYIEFERVGQPKGGLYVDDAGKAKLYDPWGREIIFAINSPIQGVYFANGLKDQMLHTWGLCEYKDTKVDARPYAMFSAGEDGLKGVEGGKLFEGNHTFAGSDDVISW